MGRRVGQTDINGGVGLGLGDVHQHFFGQFQQGNERDQQHGHAQGRVKQLVKFYKALALEFFQHDAHVLTHGQFLATDFVVLNQFGPSQNVGPRLHAENAVARIVQCKPAHAKNRDRVAARHAILPLPV